MSFKDWVGYLDSAATILFNMDDIVIKFESLMSFWDILREIEDEIKKRKKRKELLLDLENSVNYP